MTNLIFDDIFKYLKENGFRRITVNGPNKWTMISDDYKLQVTIEEGDDTLTKEDEERIKQRLKDLGYL